MLGNMFFISGCVDILINLPLSLPRLFDLTNSLSNGHMSCLQWKDYTLSVLHIYGAFCECTLLRLYIMYSMLEKVATFRVFLYTKKHIIYWGRCEHAAGLKVHLGPARCYSVQHWFWSRYFSRDCFCEAALAMFIKTGEHSNPESIYLCPPSSK